MSFTFINAFFFFFFFTKQLENCLRPVIITKDLSMVIYGRDARIGPRSLKSLFSGRSGTTNRSSAIYELSLKCANKAGSPGTL